MPRPPRLLTSSELAYELGLSRRSISRYAKRGWITPEFKTPGGQYRWDLETVRRELQTFWTLGPGSYR